MFGENTESNLRWLKKILQYGVCIAVCIGLIMVCWSMSKFFVDKTPGITERAIEENKSENEKKIKIQQKQVEEEQRNLTVEQLTKQTEDLTNQTIETIDDTNINYVPSGNAFDDLNNKEDLKNNQRNSSQSKNTNNTRPQNNSGKDISEYTTEKLKSLPTNSKGAIVQNIPENVVITNYFPATAYEKPIPESVIHWLSYLGYSVQNKDLTVDIALNKKSATCTFGDWLFDFKYTDYGWCMAKISKKSSLTPIEQQNIMNTYTVAKDNQGYWVCNLK